MHLLSSALHVELRSFYRNDCMLIVLTVGAKFSFIILLTITTWYLVCMYKSKSRVNITKLIFHLVRNSSFPRYHSGRVCRFSQIG